jgi:hypothetical protein
MFSLVFSLVFSWCLQGSSSGFWGGDRYFWAGFQASFTASL